MVPRELYVRIRCFHGSYGTLCTVSSVYFMYEIFMVPSRCILCTSFSWFLVYTLCTRFSWFLVFTLCTRCSWFLVYFMYEVFGFCGS